jgi:hypothetical protein
MMTAAEYLARANLSDWAVRQDSDDLPLRYVARAARPSPPRKGQPAGAYTTDRGSPECDYPVKAERLLLLSEAPLMDAFLITDRFD